MKNTMNPTSNSYKDKKVWSVFNKHFLRLIVVASVILLSTQLYAEAENLAETHNINISQHEFEPWSFTANPGDIIEFVNHSNISHSIYIITSDGEIINIDQKLYVQTPGVSIQWTIPSAGEYTLKCWIHPSINATLLVPEPTDTN